MESGDLRTDQPATRRAEVRVSLTLTLALALALTLALTLPHTLTLPLPLPLPLTLTLTSPPPDELALRWVYGFRGFDTRSAALWASPSTIVYPAGKG